ncbi:very-long-chain 3-oxoacyl-CoA reductase-A-like [Diachasmimorpha longicaudata]|uniref:very-long-chain 3-oxoacyl-CoA reductase-A-like n=1 Tax=Diachasmimorpha longicaudata TaxID=58733 RepID=UPI0030B919EB
MSLFTQLSYLSFAYWSLRAYYSLFLRVYRVFFTSDKFLDLNKFGKWCMVTGCTQGLGKSFLGSLAERNFSLILVGPITEGLGDLASDLELLYNVETKVIDLDMTSRQVDYQKLEKEIEGLEIGILINNFSVNYGYPEYFLEVKDSQEVFNDIIWSNVVLVTQMCRIVMPQMVERKKGVVINISSTFALVPSPLMSVFAASKAFVLKFSKDLSVEYGKKGIIVQCLCPGSIANDEERWISPNSKVYVESALTTIGKDSITTGFFPHTLVIGLIRVLWRLSPDTLIEWMTAIMERNRRRELSKTVY